MSSPTQRAQLIRFGLGKLGETNAHHEFERICWGLARHRIASNLVPATGPASGGGDQGRDGESHWTNLPNELPGSSVFVAMASTEKVVLACTIQQANIPSKIRKDLALICGQGDVVRRVVYFTVTGVPVGRRHELRAEARQKYGVALEIWDGVAIAQHLSDPDLTYLATEFLHLPDMLTSELAHGKPAAGPARPYRLLRRFFVAAGIVIGLAVSLVAATQFGSDSQFQQQQSEALRAKREQVYLDYLSAIDALAEATDAYVFQCPDAKTSALVAFKCDGFTSFYPHYARYEQAAATIRLYWSSTVKRAAEVMIQLLPTVNGHFEDDKLHTIDRSRFDGAREDLQHAICTDIQIDPDQVCVER